MAWLIRATPPQGLPAGRTTPYEIPAINVEFDQEFNDPSTLNFDVETDFELYADETNVLNSLQVGAYIEALRSNGHFYRGFIYQRNIEEDAGRRYIHVQCFDLLGRFKRCLATYTDGDTLYSWTRTTPALELTAIELEQLGPIGDSLYPFMPEVSHYSATPRAYLPSTVTNETAVGAGDWNIGDTVLKATATNGGMLPAGLIKVDTEWIQYDGYIYDGSVWWFHNCVRGALDSNAATHTAGATVDQVVSKKVHPSVPVVLEVNNGSAWEIVPSTLYQVQIEEGRFDLNAEPAAISSTGSVSAAPFLRATYGVFDETNTYSNGTLQLSDVVKALVAEATTTGGAGLVAAEYSIDTTFGATVPDIALAVVECKKPTFLHTKLVELMEDTGLVSSIAPEFNAIGMWMRHSDGDFCFQSISQGAATITFPEHTYGQQEFTLEGIASAVLVNYEAGLNFNLAAPGRFWHPAVGEALGGENVDFWLKLDAADTGSVHWVDTNTAGNDTVGKLITDGKLETGWGLSVSSPDNPGDDLKCLWAWFPVTADSSPDPADFRVNEISITLDLSFTSSTTDPVSIQVLGVTAFDIADPPSSTGIIHLSGNLELIYPGGLDGNTAGQTSVTLTADDLDVPLQGIVIAADGLPQSEDGDREIRIRELLIRGNLLKSKFVRLTGSYVDTLDARYIYAPLSYAKLVGAVPDTGSAPFAMNQHTVQVIDIGSASDNVALSLGRQALVQSLQQLDIRNFVIESSITSIPTMGDVVTITKGDASGSDFTGTVIGVNYRQVNGAEVLTLRLINYNSTVLGA